jgi:hypothetical protein
MTVPSSLVVIVPADFRARNRIELNSARQRDRMAIDEIKWREKLGLNTVAILVEEAEGRPELFDLLLGQFIHSFVRRFAAKSPAW